MVFVQGGLAKVSIELSGWKDCGAEGLTDMSKVAQSQQQRQKLLDVLGSVNDTQRKARIKQDTRLWLSKSCSLISSFSGMSGWAGRMHKLQYCFWHSLVVIQMDYSLSLLIYF